MNLGQLRTRCAEFLGDPNQTRYSGKYNAAINDANTQFAVDAKCVFKDASFTSVAAQSTYDLPTDFMWEDKATFDGILITPISRFDLELEKEADSWQDDEGTPQYFMVDPEEANKKLRLYPKPKTGDAGKTIVLRYYAKPTTMSSDSSEPLNGYALLAQFHLAISAYAAWLLMTNEQFTPAVVEKRRELLQIYNDMVSKAVDTFKNTASEPIQMMGGRANWWNVY